MECNKEEAVRAKQIAESKMQMGDYIAAQKIARKAQQLFPDLENISQLLAVCEVHCSSQSKPFGSEMDWYGILQIERFADEATIKKQYRKLALSLHPDKNKFAGAEAAFKLIGEAHRVLSDQTKRSVYDMKFRAIVKTAVSKPPPHQSYRNSYGKKQNGAPHNFPIAPQSKFPNAPQNNFTNASHSQSKGSHFDQEAQPSTFWTCCHYCGIRYQYYSTFINRVLRCQKCQRTFTAYDLGIKGVPPGSHPTQFPNQKEVPNQGPSKVASQSNGGKPTYMSFAGLHPMSKAGSTSRVGVGSKPEEKVGEKEGDGVCKPDAAKPRKSGPSRNASKKRGRKSVEESSDSCKTGSSDDREENGDDISGGYSGLNGDHLARRSSRQKQHVSYKENFSDDDFVSPLKRSKGNRSSNANEEELKEAAVVGGVPKDDNPAGSAVVDTCKEEVKQKASAPLEESLPNKKSRIGECKTKKEEAAMSDHNDKKPEVDDDSKLSSDFGLDPEILEYPDPDFNDFEQDRAENCFAVNQVWAIYDTVDGMPRFYARVNRKISPGFKLQITWLEPNPDDQGEQDWCNVELPVACGKYSNGGSEETADRLMFSHRMYSVKGGARGSYFIYPRRGETWALFRNWDIKWSSTLEKHKPPYQYEVVEVVSDFVANAGVKVTYLGKVKGFVSLFQQTELQGIVPLSEMYRFSHRIPSFRMTGKEREGVTVGSFELDPASLPTDLDGLCDPGDVKMENASPDNEANGSSVKSPESKVKPIVMGLSRMRTPKKHEGSDPERETSAPRRSLRESDGTRKNQSEVDTSQCMKEEDVSKYINNVHLTEPKGSATKCQADERSNTPKKHENNDLATDALKLRRSPRDSNKKNGQVNASQCATQVETDKHSDASKEEHRGSLAESKGSASTKKFHNSMKPPGASTPVSSGCRTLEAECYDFKKEKSEEKFQLDQIWAMYSDRDGMPKDYAQVKKIESLQDFRLHVALLKPCSQSKNTAQPVCCGMFKVTTGKTKIVPRSFFSHQLRAEPVGKKIYEIYPRKGEVWAVYKNWNSDSTCPDLDKGECDIVEVLEDNDQNIEVVVLTRINGSNSLFKAPRIQRSKTGVLNIPRAELARFSHQIPAFQHAGKKDNCLRGYWELDPSATPGVIICLD